MNLTLNEVLDQIRKWKKEANNHRNDGWTMAHYQEFLKRIRMAARNDEEKEFSPPDPGLSQDEKFGF